ncbi:MAG: bifunctional (p)ppGpp synthetase/guanosine-3',5'-bis(diphosphate) 3'-pyrophosphohydrolase [Bacteroidaceae bacterium]|nr:bifunctional (p)ppGpp synthetase/guanosine-3',5'-bis(diphosphate) 3'-pyrophosphohydrolase [Bacteroidaceae bacterium]
MEDTVFLTINERKLVAELYKELKTLSGTTLQEDDCQQVKQLLIDAVVEKSVQRDAFGLNPIVLDMQTAVIVASEIGLMRASILSIMLHRVVKSGYVSIEKISQLFGEDVGGIIHGLIRISDLYAKNPTIESENFRDLLLSFAEDMRVVLIMIADRVNLMRQIGKSKNEEARQEVSREAAFLYAPLAHKLGLYKLKSELEDLSLKYLEHDAYYHIKEKLNATKKARDQYIADFIRPIDSKLRSMGLKCHVKGRTKSIHSIYQKMKKQNTTFEGVYDLFAIRVILDSKPEREKADCWLVYSIITDMYQPNPKRLRDWLSVPKSNGYESLHITVLGPQKKWVEVQIRTERMDEIAERGLAAHWRYKGVKSEAGLDDWLNSIRRALENTDNQEAMNQFKMDLYVDEVFVFTPKGDLFKLPKGATVLDFAYHIHSRIGDHCIGARVNGKGVPIREQLSSGDQVEILTSNKQEPKQDWLNVVTTSRARSKIRLSLKEIAAKQNVFARETLERKFKNRKVEMEEAVMGKLVKKMGYKQINDFYSDIVNNIIDINDILENYIELQKAEHGELETAPAKTAQDFELKDDELKTHANSDVLVIGENLKGVDFTLAKCCNPIYGDRIFGFVTSTGGFKIHRVDCPNAPELFRRFGYRTIQARWAGKGQSQYESTLHIIGNDDIGIVNNITSIILKEPNCTLRAISIDSNDGMFGGHLTVMVDDNRKLEQLIKKLKTVKGVLNINRS